MTLGEKRKVIEVLLCAASSTFGDGPPHAVTITYACDAFAEPGDSERESLFFPAFHARRRASEDAGHYGEFSPYALGCVEAAYRLIESSATLRREWFGR